MTLMTLKADLTDLEVVVDGSDLEDGGANDDSLQQPPIVGSPLEDRGRFVTHHVHDDVSRGCPGRVAQVVSQHQELNTDTYN